MIATKIGTLMMLDSYTTTMCLDSWGGSSYARALIEIDASNDMLDSLVVVVPKLEESGYTKEAIRIEYEWKLSRCGTCLIYGHSSDSCPKAVNEVNVSNLKVVDDGFRVVKNGVKGENTNSRPFVVPRGGSMFENLDVESNSKEHEDNIPKVNIKSADLGNSTTQYKPAKGNIGSSSNGGTKGKSSEIGNWVNISNSFDALKNLDVESNSKEHEDNIPKVNIKSADLGNSTTQCNKDSESDVEEVHDESAYFMASKLPKATTRILIKMEVELENRACMNAGKRHWMMTHEAFSLTKGQMDLCNSLDINLRGQIR
ncbi:reverse transcriptase domain-containing protein [Tanacetum coccineum]